MSEAEELMICVLNQIPSGCQLVIETVYIEDGFRHGAMLSLKKYQREDKHNGYLIFDLTEDCISYLKDNIRYNHYFTFWTIITGDRKILVDCVDGNNIAIHNSIMIPDVLFKKCGQAYYHVWFEDELDIADWI